MGNCPCIFSRKHPCRSEDVSIENDNTLSSNESGENENENYIPSYKLLTPTLEKLKNVLYVALNPYFEEFEIAVISCPCLTRAPYNLAAAGLSGNTGILELGDFKYFSPTPQTDVVFDIQDILSRCNVNDTFVIGSGFAAKPAMPFNGHLTMNAVVSANSTNVINNSCIVYEVVPEELKMKITYGHNHIKCSLVGQFFFSEGKQRPVIKIRAKGRRSRSNITALIETALSNCCQYLPLMGLGIVLVLNGGQTAQLILPHDFVCCRYNQNKVYYERLIPYNLNCKNLIALGALYSAPVMTLEDDNKRVLLRNDYSMFNTISNFQSGGEFFNDVTPEETEYTVYINIAQERWYKY